MRTLFVATDFSENGNRAASYGYKLATQLKTNVILCNAFIVPAELPQADAMVWPSYDYETLTDENGSELDALKSKLEAEDKTHGFKPVISCHNDIGFLVDVINEVLEKHETDLIITGTHHRGFEGAVTGDHCRMLIDSTLRPLLLVPPEAAFSAVKKIAFASDFTDVNQDLRCIHRLIGIAKRLNAEILLTYIYSAKTAGDYRKRMNDLLTELSNAANYPHIYFRLIDGERVEDGLSWLCAHGDVDILAMVHRPKNLFEKLFNGSHTQKMAAKVKVPLLVYPADRK